MHGIAGPHKHKKLVSTGANIFCSMNVITEKYEIIGMRTKETRAI